MGIIKTARQFLKKSLNAVTLTGKTEGGLMTLLGQDYRFGTKSKDFLLQAYGANPYVFMVIDRICQRLVQIDKKLIGKGEIEIEDPDFLLLLKNPNPKEDGNAFLYRAAATYLASGECFVVRHQELDDADAYFVPINYNVTVNQNTKGQIINYWISTFGNVVTYLPGEVLHIFKPDITYDTNRGFSTLRATRKVWESNNEVWASEASLHKNKGITGVLYSDGNRPMTDTERDQLQTKYDNDSTGAENFGKVKISTSKLGYVQMGMNPNDLKSIETRLEHLRTTCASFNVDSKLFGDPAASTYNNMPEAQRAFIVNAVAPLANILLPKIIGFMGRSVFQLSYSMILDEDTISELTLTNDQRSARLGREVLQGLLTAEEARGLLYPEMAETTEGDGGDTLEDNPAAETANAEAQANLRGSVGGVQGILQIQASVAAGTTSRESAIVILMNIFGFDEQTAGEILGPTI